MSRLALGVVLALCGCDALSDKPPAEWDVASESIAYTVTLRSAATVRLACTPGETPLVATGDTTFRFDLGGPLPTRFTDSYYFYADTASAYPFLRVSPDLPDAYGVASINRNMLWWYFSERAWVIERSPEAITVDVSLKGSTASDTLRVTGTHRWRTRTVPAHTPTRLDACVLRYGTPDFFTFEGGQVQRWREHMGLRYNTWNVVKRWTTQRRGDSLAFVPNPPMYEPETLTRTYRLTERGDTKVLETGDVPLLLPPDELARWSAAYGLSPESVVQITERHRLVLRRHR